MPIFLALSEHIVWILLITFALTLSLYIKEIDALVASNEMNGHVFPLVQNFYFGHGHENSLARARQQFALLSR